jgi:hypothetical protein
MLENLFTASLLFGQRNALGRLPAPPASSSLPMLIGFGLLSLVVMAMVVAFNQYRQRRKSASALNSPSELWAELCRVHHLDKTDSAALRELAEARALEPAASVFVRADLWQLENDSANIRHLRPQLQKLQAVIFGGPEKAPVVVKI